MENCGLLSRRRHHKSRAWRVGLEFSGRKGKSIGRGLPNWYCLEIPLLSPGQARVSKHALSPSPHLPHPHLGGSFGDPTHHQWSLTAVPLTCVHASYCCSHLSPPRTPSIQNPPPAFPGVAGGSPSGTYGPRSLRPYHTSGPQDTRPFLSDASAGSASLSTLLPPQ